MPKPGAKAVQTSDVLKELQSNALTSVGNYVFGRTIGEGSFGKVKLGWHKLTGQQVAIKIVDKTHAPAVVREIETWRNLRHPNIAQLYEVLTTETKIYMISEFASGGEAFDMILRRGRMDDRSPLAKRLFQQVVEAIKYCHDRNYCHRDLKLENVLLTEDLNVKVIDFGFTRELPAAPAPGKPSQLLDTYCGSMAYAAPEMVMCKQYLGPQADIWSLGVILFTLVCGYLPFDDDNENEVNVQKKISELNYEVPDFVSDSAKDLITRILKLDPAERISLADVLNHPWFTDVPPGSTEGLTAVAKDLPVNVPPLPASAPLLQLPSTPNSSAPNSAPATPTLPATSSSYPIPLSPAETQLANTLSAAGFDVHSILRSVKHSACDQASAMWHLLLERSARPTSGMEEADSMKGGAWSWAKTFLEKEKDGKGGAGPASGSIGSLSRPKRTADGTVTSPTRAVEPIPKPPGAQPPPTPRQENTAAPARGASDSERESGGRRGIFDNIMGHSHGLLGKRDRTQRRGEEAKVVKNVIKEDEEEDEEEADGGKKKEGLKQVLSDTKISSSPGSGVSAMASLFGRRGSEPSPSSPPQSPRTRRASEAEPDQKPASPSLNVAARKVYSARHGAASKAAPKGRFGGRGGRPVGMLGGAVDEEKEETGGVQWEVGE